MRSWTKTLAAVACLSLALAGTCVAENLPQNEDEKALETVETDVLTLQRKLSAARKRGDAEETKRLQKQFDKAQKKRLGLLRSTWQM